MATLLNISGDLLELKRRLEAVVDEHGEIRPEDEEALTAWFASLGEQRDEKVDSYVALIRELQLRSMARKEEAERLLARVRVDTNLADRLKARLLLFMQQQSLRTLETTRYKLTVAGNGGKQGIAVDDNWSETLPTVCRKVTESPDMENIRSLLEAGVPIAGCRLVERGNHLRIG